MKPFKEYNGVFTVLGHNYSNAVLQIRDSNSLNVWLASLKKYWELSIREQHLLSQSLVFLLCPNEFWGLKTVFIYYNKHVSHDGEEWYDYQEEDTPHDGYHGYLPGTRYLDGSEDGTYWNCFEEVPFMYEHNASYDNAIAQHQYFLKTGELLY